MTVVEVEQVVAAHRHEWRKWPDTDDMDYASVKAERWTWVFRRGDVELRVKNRFYPVYSAYVSSGDLALPIRFPVIDNLCPPSQAVRDQQRRDLASFTDCSALLWEHTHQCFPDVACELPGRFKLRAISFGDDCPGSSDVKTFPVAAYFNAILYSMFVWNPDTGALTAEEYRRRGIPYQRFIPSAPSVGFVEGLRDTGFSIEEKQRRIRAGGAAPDVAFVGFNGSGERAQIMRGMRLAHARQRQLGLSLKIHGVDMPDGVLEPRDPPHPRGLGYPMVPLYAGALSSFNVPISSLFNCRLVDLWLSGTVQFVRDRWGELARMGFVDGEHYLSFATAEDLLEQLARLKAEPERAAEVVGRASAKAGEFWTANGWDAAYGDLYFDHLDVFV